MQVTLLLLAVWWVWVYTTWVTNWLDPEQTPVRIVLFVLMLGGLVLSTTIPKAFEGRGLWFAMAYVAMQVGRTLFLLWRRAAHRPQCVTTRAHPGLALRFRRVLDLRRPRRGREARSIFWMVALAIEYISPRLPLLDARARRLQDR